SIGLRDPAFVLFVAQPLVLEVRKPFYILECLDLFRRISARLFRPVQPERAAGLWRKVPAHDLANMRIQSLLRRLPGEQIRHNCLVSIQHSKRSPSPVPSQRERSFSWGSICQSLPGWAGG